MKTSLLARLSPREIMRVDVSIDDICKNGYEVISVYSSIFSLDGRPEEEKIIFEGRTYYETGSFSSEDILEHFPHLAPVLKVNHCDMFGFHSYPLMDLQYHCQHSKEYAIEKYRLTPEQVDLFADLNYGALAKRLYALSESQYKNEISEAVKIVEELTGEKFMQKEKVSHQLYNDIVYCITSTVPKKERGWNLIKGTYPESYPIDLK